MRRILSELNQDRERAELLRSHRSLNLSI
jgi:hypothetical protein